MGSKMLIDAVHPEETRVVVVRGNRVEDFDYESATRKQLRGNIYLAKVTRVEPSLQAAFVDYGGNRHGFLAFSEIHPDYYQIPVADRKALLEEEAEEESRARAEEEADDNGGSRRRRKSSRRGKKPDGAEALEAVDGSESVSEEAPPPGDEAAAVEADAAEAADPLAGEHADEAEDTATGEDEISVEAAGQNGENVESVGSEDALEELPTRTRRRKRNYKIQEVIKRRQIILIQVVKEERGNKGAALTTYLSLAGRYTVMMPNTARGGGISRKITNAADRKKLRKIAGDLEVADGMGLIIRTAGASRTKTEIKRDFEYLLRLWENIRDLTLKSTAPALVYEEGNLIKRSIRDLYNKEIDQILVSGDEAYKEAKGFMRMLMPSHAKNVQPYKEPEPVFVRHKIERQLSAMYSPYVTLKSGGYIVINQTEALVSVDVNSGKSTREHSIEDTALKTNLEASEEVARQLRLRDLAGLIVIDFIDMEERRNNRSVERKLKDCLRHDRARIQVGRISHFGLLEMSRQRLRSGMIEGSTTTCAMCQGTGVVRSTESVALDVLRTLEDTLLNEGRSSLRAATCADVALYILNYKREMLKDIEARYGITILIEADAEQHGSAFTIEKTAAIAVRSGDPVVQIDSALLETDLIGADEETEEARSESDGEGQDEQDSEGGRKRGRRRRRRGGRGRGRSGDGEMASADGRDRHAGDDDEEESAGEPVAASESESGEDGDEDREQKPRRRGRRGGRRSRGRNGENARAADANGEDHDDASADTVAADTAAQSGPAPEPEFAEAGVTEGDTESVESVPQAEIPAGDGDTPEPKQKKAKVEAVKAEAEEPQAEEPSAEVPLAEEPMAEEIKAQEAPAEAKSGNGKDDDDEEEPAAKPSKREQQDSSKVLVDGVEAEPQEEKAPRRSGWWQRRA